MRKYFVFAAAALVVLAACQKKDAERVSIKNPDWVEDESLPVPIEIGGLGIAETKGTPITNTAFSSASFRYNVIALNKETDDVMAGFAGSVLAHNVAGANDPIATGTGDNLTGQTVVEFLDNNGVKKDMYYPYLYKDGAFNFYGFRIDGTTPSSLSGTIISGIQMGPNDIIWAKAEAKGSDETAANEGNISVGRTYEDSYGFSARYIRGIRREYVTNNGNMADYIDALPHLDFDHITSQIQFYINAFDQIAENTLSGAHVAVSAITIGGTDTNYPTASAIAATANLNIKTGIFTQNTAGTISVDNIASNFAITQAGAQCGDPLFIMPFTGNILLTISLTLPNMTEPEQIKTVLVAPAIAATATSSAVAAGTFAPGYVYRFTISLESIEKINIVTSLSPWPEDPIEPTQPIVID